MILKFILKIVITNPGKLLFLTASIVSFFFAGRIPNEIDHKHIISESSSIIDGKKIYFCVYEDGSSYEVYAFDEKPIVHDNMMSISKYHIANVLLWTAFVISFICFILAPILEEDFKWGFSDIHTELVEKYKLRCVFEDNTYYYIINNRLLAKSEHALTSYHSRNLIEDYLENKNRYPIYHTIAEKRDMKMDKLGVN